MYIERERARARERERADAVGYTLIWARHETLFLLHHSATSHPPPETFLLL